MPTVPSYDSPQVAPAALPGVRQDRAPSSLFSAGGEQLERFGNSLQSAGAEGLAIATDMQERQNADMFLRAEAAINTEYTAFKATIADRRGLRISVMPIVELWLSTVRSMSPPSASAGATRIASQFEPSFSSASPVRTTTRGSASALARRPWATPTASGSP